METSSPFQGHLLSRDTLIVLLSLGMAMINTSHFHTYKHMKLNIWRQSKDRQVLKQICQKMLSCQEKLFKKMTRIYENFTLKSLEVSFEAKGKRNITKA